MAPPLAFRRIRNGAIVVLATANLACAIAILYPGWYSHDSSWLLVQARTGAYSNIQPPGMALLWSGLLDMGLAPGALLVLNLALLATGIALLGLSIRRPHALAVPLALLWPPFLAIFGHLWTDVSLAALLTFATGWIAWTRATGRPGLLWLAALPLAYAVGVRHNAIFAVPPLLFLLVAPVLRRRVPATTATAALTIAIFGVWVAVSKSIVVIPTPVWPVAAIWDLSAASVASGEMLLPPGVRGPGLTVEELRPLVNADTVFEILTGTASGINAGVDEPLPPEAQKELGARWLLLPFTHPQAWVRHRLAVTWSMLGPQRIGKWESLFIAPYTIALRDNPAIVTNTTAANAWLVKKVRDWRDTPWCAPLSYLLLALAAAALALRPRFTGDRALVLALAIGAWLYAAPLTVLAASAEWRYMLWPMLAAALAMLLALDGGRQAASAPSP
jgi:hypothetical protein